MTSKYGKSSDEIKWWREVAPPTGRCDQVVRLSNKSGVLDHQIEVVRGIPWDTPQSSCLPSCDLTYIAIENYAFVDDLPMTYDFHGHVSWQTIRLPEGNPYFSASTSTKTNNITAATPSETAFWCCFFCNSKCLWAPFGRLQPGPGCLPGAVDCGVVTTHPVASRVAGRCQSSGWDGSMVNLQKANWKITIFNR